MHRCHSHLSYLQTENLYGVQPVYMNVEQEGNAHMVLIKNANAQGIFYFRNIYNVSTYASTSRQRLYD